jgi:5'-3' exonuclease
VLNYLARLISDRRPDRLIAAFDADWRPAFRVEALPTYKAHRVAGPDDPKDLVEPQIDILVELLDTIGISTARAEGFEAEDVIATIAAHSRGPMEIVTGDRDLFALVRDPDVRILYTLRGVSELALVDEAWIAAKYRIPGRRYLDYALLRGDPSDGLPGVPGIGDKTASALVAKYGSLDAILAARDLPATVGARLRSAGSYLDAARSVVAPVRDAPVVGGDGALPLKPRDAERLDRLAARFAVGGPIDRLRGAVNRRLAKPS